MSETKSLRSFEALPRLELRDLRIGYGEWSVGEINLSVAAGELVAVVGPSGCGKSTLLKTILGAVPAIGGAVRVNGRDVTSLSIKDHGIGIVFQEPLLFGQLNVYENVAYGLGQQRAINLDKRVEEMLELVQLPKPWTRRVDELSGGQMQRVALARALAPSPAVLLLDEPLSALDADLRVELGDSIRRLTKTNAAAAVYVTHDLLEAQRVCDRIVHFNDWASAVSD